MEYAVFSSSQDGVNFDYEGNVEKGIKLAKKQAKAAFPGWIDGYGPTIVVLNDDGEEMHRETL